MAFRSSKPLPREKDIFVPPTMDLQKEGKSISDVMLAFQTQQKKDMQDMKVFFEEKYSGLNQRVIEAITQLVGHLQRIDKTYEDLYQSHKVLEEKVAQYQEEAVSDGLLAQYKATEFAVRIRGLPENSKENLREILAEFFAQRIGYDKNDLLWQMDCVYRVNSRFANQRNLPRDVVVYFVTRKLRNDILQATYNQKLKLLTKDIILFKEIPSRILTIRRGYKFLTEVLRSKQISYRWAVPIGIWLNFQNKDYLLNTIAQAEEFYTSKLKCGLPSSRIKDQEVESIKADLKNSTNQDDSDPEMDLEPVCPERKSKKKSRKNKRTH